MQKLGGIVALVAGILATILACPGAFAEDETPAKWM